jgi:hypothetical protein
MSDINPAYFDRVQYTLSNKNQGTVVVTEPIGWSSDEKEIAKNEQYFGVVARFSNSSKYIGSAKDFIELVRKTEGVMGEIVLTRKEKHPLTDEWIESYSGNLDLMTWSKEDNQVSIKFNSGGIQELLKSRETEMTEIDRTTTIDGKPLEEMQPVTVALDGRRIFLKSVLEQDNDTGNVSIFSTSNDGNTRGGTVPVPLKIISKSQEMIQTPFSGIQRGDNSWDRSGKGQNSLCFFAIADRDRIVDVSINLKFKIRFAWFDNVDNFRFWCRLVTYKNGDEYNHKENLVLFTDNNYNRLNEKTFSINFSKRIDLKKGESLALVFDQNVDFYNTIGTQNLKIEIKEIESKVIVEEDSFFEKSTTKAILAHEFFERLVAIATNSQKSFVSNYFGRKELGYKEDGPGAYIAFTHGFWVRQFDKFPIPTEGPPKIENLFKPLTTSFKEAFISVDALKCMGMGIEKVGFKEVVRIELLSYFFNNNVTIKLANQVKKIKRSVATEYVYSSLEFGDEKSGTYEEATGLNEPNTKNTYTTIISKVKEPYTKVSKYRLDSTGLEFARRKQKYLSETEDTAYDNDIFVLDLKKGQGDVYEQRKWQDDFEKEPTGIFSPETATNLRFSPFNCLLNHSWFFSNCLTKNSTDYVRYSSSKGNSQLSTKLIGKNEYSENGNIINAELSTPRFVPEWIEFEHKVSYYLLEKLEGKSMILGNEIINIYGLVEFINEDNEIEKGFIFSVKPNAQGQFKVLKSNR